MSNAATEALPLANGTFSKQKLYNEYCKDVISSDFEYFPHWWQWFEKNACTVDD